jgi:anti-sigma factor RsiW
MTQRNNHVPQDDIQAFVDGRLEREEERAVRNHLSLCRECRESYEGLRAFDSALRRLPLERTTPAFTAGVMHRLGLLPQSRRVTSLAENIAYLAGLLLVLGAMVGIFALTGVLGGGGNASGLSSVADVLGKTSKATARGIDSFTGWLMTFFPFAFGKGALSISLVVVLAVAVLALVDRAAERLLLHKTE